MGALEACEVVTARHEHGVAFVDEANLTQLLFLFLGRVAQLGIGLLFIWH